MRNDACFIFGLFLFFRSGRSSYIFKRLTCLLRAQVSVVLQENNLTDYQNLTHQSINWSSADAQLINTALNLLNKFLFWSRLTALKVKYSFQCSLKCRCHWFFMRKSCKNNFSSVITCVERLSCNHKCFFWGVLTSLPKEIICSNHIW